MAARVRTMLYIDPDVAADLRELAAKLQADALRAGGKPKDADSMSDIAEAALRVEIAKRKKSLK